MRGKSHIALGNCLIHRFLPGHPLYCRRAFLLGCIQPDRNPLTYLKGSLRKQWLRGHNYPNACRFMHRISRRLESRQKLYLWDYYTLGKLIHYTCDAFTYPHNPWFCADLQAHRHYEHQLQEYFLTYLNRAVPGELACNQRIMECIRKNHRDYSRENPNILRDSQFAFHVSCSILAILFAPKPV